MMKFALIIALALAVPAAAAAQLKFNLDHLAKNAKESVEITLDSTLLQLAGRFLSSGKADEAKAKELITGLKSIYVRSFEFDRADAFTTGDLEPIRAQLQGPGWNRILRHTGGSRKGRDGDELAEIYVRMEGGKSTGIAIIAAEPRELTIVHILGDIDPEKLDGLSGHFGIPKLPKVAK